MGKTDSGEFIVDGYTFKGKRPFKQTFLEVKDIMKKGVENVVGDLKFKALDVRIKGAATEIEVEIFQNGNRGVANLKLYGPNIKKDNVVMVTKNKASDAEYVTCLAANILKPLMKTFVSRKIKTEKTDNNEKEEKKADIYKCPHCDKVSVSSSGLKCHITKMHNEKKDVPNTTEVDRNKISKLVVTKDVQQSSKDINDLMESLLDEVIVISDDEGSVDLNITINEKVSGKEDVTENVFGGDDVTDKVSGNDDVTEIEKKDKEYCESCDKCEYQTVANMKHLSVQMLLNHKNECHKRKCLNCNFKAKDKVEMRRHMRDEHEIMTGSTSPPLKRKRKNVETVEVDDDMDIDNC